MYICTDFIANGKDGIVLYDSMINNAKVYSYDMVKSMLEREIPIMGLYISKDGVIVSSGKLIDGKITVKTRLVEPKNGCTRKEFISVRCNSWSFEPCYKFYINDTLVGEIPEIYEYENEESCFVDVDSYCGKVLALFAYKARVNEDRDEVVKLALFFDGKKIAENEVSADEYFQNTKKYNTIDREISSDIVMWNGKEIYLD